MKLSLFIAFVLFAQVAAARVIIAGSGQPVSSLAGAVKMAGNGDTIFLKKGIYREGNILLTRPVTILGEANGILDGQHKTELLTISGKNISVKNLVLQNAGYSALNDCAAIKVIDATAVLIEQNIILNAYF